MKILIAEDDYVSRKFLYKFLSKYGECDITIDGYETLEVFIMAIEEKKYYDLICLDIMMPKLDGVEVLKMIREIEEKNEISEKNKSKIIMTTALNSTESVFNSYENGSEAYAVKPIDTEKFVSVMRNLGLIDI
ncbi:response regulator [Helicovermis profundi]|uniref:Stage 0 sporulation protein A homolog n=1 Tax=Helicovermis profundi TaxID=3065157 RepID=A0AAU9EJ88_9FIRM|nr:response regulator [Clostridia bacterium S502]